MSGQARVLVLPGFNATDHSTSVLRAAVALQGHRVHGWNLGRNNGPDERTLAGLQERLVELFERGGQPVSLIGWSLGGVYAHWLTRSTPHLVRRVITLGSPLNRDGPAPALAVPTTSVYSRNDRIVHWHTSLIDSASGRHENVEVRSNHVGLGFDPAVLYLIGDRLRRSPDEWTSFRPPLWLQTAFPDPVPPTVQGTVRAAQDATVNETARPPD